MTGLSRFGLGLAALTVAAMATPAAAQPASDGPRHLVPGTVMIFPVFDARDGFNTIITITNTNTDRRVHDNRFRTGDVSVHFVYIDAIDWEEFNRDEDLTPGDTFSTLVSEHAIDGVQGWLWVEARDPENPDRAIDFDYLIGSAILTNSDFNLEWKYAPYVFRGCPGEETEPPDQENCDSWDFSCTGFKYIDDEADPTDDDDDAEELNFDGIEYDFFPEFLIIDQFFGEGSPPELPAATFANTLYLLSTEMEGTTLALLFFNNNEEDFSVGDGFDCWIGQALSLFNDIATEEEIRDDYNPDELRGIPYGWVRISANDPILGCFVQQITRNRLDFIAGDALHFSSYREATLERFF